MRKARHICLPMLLVSLSLCCSHDEGPNKTYKRSLEDDFTALQGEWMIESITYEGESESELVGTRYVFQDDTITILLRTGEKDQFDFRFFLSAPKGKYRRIETSPASFITSESPSKCIYALEENTLKLCAAMDKFPDEFATRKGDGRRLTILRRVAKGQ